MEKELEELVADKQEQPKFVSKRMRSLTEVIELIGRNYKVDFVVEQVTYDGTKTVYYLKRKKVQGFMKWKWETFDHETNNLNYKIAFKSLEEIESYLRQQYSESQGFKTESLDMN